MKDVKTSMPFCTMSFVYSIGMSSLPQDYGAWWTSPHPSTHTSVPFRVCVQGWFWCVSSPRGCYVEQVFGFQCRLVYLTSHVIYDECWSYITLSKLLMWGHPSFWKFWLDKQFYAESLNHVNKGDYKWAMRGWTIGDHRSKIVGDFKLRGNCNYRGDCGCSSPLSKVTLYL